MRTVRGVEVGNIFKLGTRYTATVGGVYLDRDGQEKPVVMGCYGIGSGRLLSCILEEHHDDRGIRFPISVAPYHVYCVAMGQREPEVAAIAERLYHDAWQHGVEMLLDDRDATPGVKFQRCRSAWSAAALDDWPTFTQSWGAELKHRDVDDTRVIPLDDVIPTLQG